MPTSVGEVTVAEAGSGPPLLLLHGAGHDRRDFDALVPSLSRRFRTLAVDLPGFGDSPVAAPRALSAAILCDVLEELVDGLRLPPAVVLGNSVGGAMAIRLAGRHPERVRGLVLVDPGGFTERTLLVRALCRLQGSEFVRRYTGRAFARHYLRRSGPLVDDLVERVGQASAESIAAHAAIWRSFALPSASVVEEARRVRCPTLLAWGLHDPILRASAEGARARAAMPSARWVPFDTGHVPFLEAKDAFLAAVTPFLDALLDRELHASP
ncbi:MAG: alpha/beta hydrolase [Myxococcales bacterium]|nr:alpha/beta hydrolase [Myxococcales bacterium]